MPVKQAALAKGDGHAAGAAAAGRARDRFCQCLLAAPVACDAKLGVIDFATLKTGALVHGASNVKMKQPWALHALTDKMNK
jgi:hypothetical protein